jgi:hypothetical protein
MARMAWRIVGRSKYAAVNAHGYDSKAEHARATELAALERAGLIEDLKQQVPYRITPDGCPPRHVVVDFQYRVLDARTVPGVRAGTIVCEDVKSPATETPVWRLKWHLARFHHPDVAWVTSYRSKSRTRTKLWPAPPTR